LSIFFVYYDSFSVLVWNLPVPCLELVSINLRALTYSASLAFYVLHGFFKTHTLFGTPDILPLIMTYDVVISPYLGKPPIGLIVFSVGSISVEADNLSVCILPIFTINLLWSHLAC